MRGPRQPAYDILVIRFTFGDCLRPRTNIDHKRRPGICSAMSGGVETIPITGSEHQKEYYPYFDWLRGILAGIVMLVHEGVIPWVSAAYLAVHVFFALS